MPSPYNLDLTAEQVNVALNAAHDSSDQPANGSTKLVQSGSIYTWVTSLFTTNLEAEAAVTSVTTTSHSVVATDRVIWVDDDTAGGDVTVTLLSAALGEGRFLTIDKLGTTGKVIISGTVDGVVNPELLVQGDKITIVSNGTSYRSVS